jgi:DNA-binding response OmpR family regulator
MKPVLVVDDEPQIRLLVKTLLSEEGFESIEASDGCSAFVTARKLDGAISLLLTDIDMPGSPMNGIELAAAVKSEFPEVPILFVSGQSPATTGLDSVAPGNEFVKKPFDPRVFADTARKLVTQATQPNHGPVRRQLGSTARETVWSRLCPDAPDGE